jgi:uncharacterized LabA/DUF88 family protein
LGWKIDWIKFRKFLADKYGVDRAYMFIGYVPEFEDMYEKLHDAGYAIVLKPTYDMTKPRIEDDPKKEEEKSTEPTEEKEKKPVKGNIDAELVLHAMIEYPNYDKAVIVSGDGDFYSLVEYLEKNGKLAKILTPSWKYSNLFNSYEKYIDRIDKCRHELEYRKFRKEYKKPE